MRTRIIKDRVGDFWLVQKWSTEIKPANWVDAQAFKHSEYRLATEYAMRLSMTKIPATSFQEAAAFEDGKEVNCTAAAAGVDSAQP